MGLNANDRVQKEPVMLTEKAECFTLSSCFLYYVLVAFKIIH